MIPKKKKQVKKKTRLKKIIFLILGVILLFIVILFIVSGVIIGKSVKEQCSFAKEKYGGDCVFALTSILDDESNSFRERNSAIWAIGQIGDKTTLAVLKKYYTGQIPNKEPLDKSISQYELKKAIELTKGGINLTAIIWRNPNRIN